MDPGIFPERSRPADVQPPDLYCDQQQFNSYAGVEEQAIADRELQAHLENGLLAVFVYEFSTCPKTSYL